eukprot:CAMPEP_0168452080 /NCGR_PEP_ID=MMETSP0228-20121227/48963_1 /TAXON_ID=133427 /ORGANISM="Protoceratium reticulatum, Strain CCCM 535 (=CCMP 1889)" /LENGTH=195 /DNA_ID=CAMNT_0008466709 /DNA_START=71 /DNA_END=655 /DNA_ORIENTATION=+
MPTIERGGLPGTSCSQPVLFDLNVEQLRSFASAQPDMGRIGDCLPAPGRTASAISGAAEGKAGHASSSTSCSEGSSCDVPTPDGFCLLGSWDNFTGRHTMPWTGNAYQCWVQLSGRGVDSFHILSEGRNDARLYPSVADANPWVIHHVLGPDAYGSGMHWTIGRHPLDGAHPGARYLVTLSAQDCVYSVRWSAKD